MKNLILLVLIILVTTMRPVEANTMTLPGAGSPDYGNNLASNPTIPSYGAGEETTRLLMGGGSNSRSGRWYWATGFENGNAEYQTAGAFPPALDYTNSHQGRAALRFAPAAGLGNASQFIKSVFGPIVSSGNNRFGIECMVSFSSFAAGNDLEFAWFMSAPKGTTLARGQYKIILKITAHHVGTLYYLDNLLVEQPFGVVNNFLVDSAGVYHYTKLVVDINQGKYARFIFDSSVFDIPYDAWLPASVDQYITHTLTTTNRDAFSLPVVLVDNVVLTADEP